MAVTSTRTGNVSWVGTPTHVLGMCRNRRLSFCEYISAVLVTAFSPNDVKCPQGFQIGWFFLCDRLRSCKKASFRPPIIRFPARLGDEELAITTACVGFNILPRLSWRKLRKVLGGSSRPSRCKQSEEDLHIGTCNYRACSRPPTQNDWTRASGARLGMLFILVIITPLCSLF